MDITRESKNGRLTAFLCGELDHHNARKCREKLDEMIANECPFEFAIDLSGLKFCDSSGLGLVMGRKKLCEERGVQFVAVNPSKAALKILNIAGLDKLIRIERNENV